jgi:hypothetical protein
MKSAPPPKQYTFSDWLEYNFVYEENILGFPVLNDSQEYLDLVMRGKMTLETLKQIQEAQAETYEILVKASLEEEVKLFERELRQSIAPDRLLEEKTRRLEMYLQEQGNTYYDVILPKVFRGIKTGAKYITAYQYLHREKQNYIFFPFYSVSYNKQENISALEAYLGKKPEVLLTPFKQPKNQNDEDFDYDPQQPLQSQILYAKVEVVVKLLQWIKSLSARPIEIENKTLLKSNQSNEASQRENLFNPPLPLKEVERYFMQLATQKNKVGGTFLSEQEVMNFINRAFCKQTEIPKATLQVHSTQEWAFIKKLFYVFYTECRRLFIAEYQSRTIYATLYSDNFQNAPSVENLLQNFNKVGLKNWKINTLKN